MKQPRFQPLSAIYKNLCTVLYDTVLVLYITDFAKPEAAEALQKTEDMLLLFAYQTAIEETLLFLSFAIMSRLWSLFFGMIAGNVCNTYKRCR